MNSGWEVNGVENIEGCYMNQCFFGINFPLTNCAVRQKQRQSSSVSACVNLVSVVFDILYIIIWVKSKLHC